MRKVGKSSKGCTIHTRHSTKILRTANLLLEVLITQEEKRKEPNKIGQ